MTINAHDLVDYKKHHEAGSSESRLPTYIIMHCHNSITDTVDNVKMAKRFACANELRKGRFKTLRRLWT